MGILMGSPPSSSWLSIIKYIRIDTLILHTIVY